MCSRNHRADSSPYTQRTFASSMVNCMPAMFVKGVKNRLCHHSIIIQLRLDEWCSIDFLPLTNTGISTYILLMV